MVVVVMEMIIFINKILVKKYYIWRKNIFFTFPKSEIAIPELIRGLLNFEPFINNLDFIIVGAEEHKDGSPHLHCLIMAKGSIRFQLKRIREHLHIKHFNDAGPIKSIAKVLKYITKDGKVTTHPEGLDWNTMVKRAEQKKNPKTDILLEKIKEVPHDTDVDEFLTDIFDTDLGGFAAFRTKHITDAFKIYHTVKMKREHVIPDLPSNLASWILGQNHPTVDIWSWLSTVLKKEMKLGDRHLYIYGPTQSGKSTLISYIVSLGWKVYFIPKSEDFFDGIKDSKWDLAVADEVRGKDQTIQFWNSWCDCYMPLKQKGKQAFLKSRIIPTILLSNYSPAGLFPKVAKENPDILDAFERRWNIIPVGPTYGLIDLPN